MVAHARFENEFMEDEKYHNLMRWLNYHQIPTLFVSLDYTVSQTEDYHEPKLSDNLVKFWHQDLDEEGQWHHLVLIFHKAGIMKNSSVSLFLDGEHVNTQKVLLHAFLLICIWFIG